MEEQVFNLEVKVTVADEEEGFEVNSQMGGSLAVGVFAVAEVLANMIVDSEPESKKPVEEIAKMAGAKIAEDVRKIKKERKNRS